MFSPNKPLQLLALLEQEHAQPNQEDLEEDQQEADEEESEGSEESEESEESDSDEEDPDQQIQPASILKVRHPNAINLLLTGKHDGEVAEEVGVTRQTVSYWRHYYPAFIAELNFRREALWGANAGRLRFLAATAIDILDNNMTEDEMNDHHDLNRQQRAAVQVLRSISLYGKHLQPQGEISPEAIARALQKTSPTSLARP